ncbi:Pre-mRNA polyadenylation factor Fip1 [Sesbania bispinosa]|nr:Pre-mRNA polyadenylation factor Fip1 [Sesbania bispinosa]
MEGLADDDFGELYADLEVLATPAPAEQDELEPEQEDSGVKNEDASDDYIAIGTDSDDDLNIVLNDEDGRSFSVGCNKDVRGDGFVVDTEGRNWGKNGACADQLKDGSELVSSDANGGFSKNGVNGGYRSQFYRPKFIRTQGSMFVNNMKANKSMGLTSDCSSFTKGRGNVIQNQISSSTHFDRICNATNSMVVQCGSFLPWYWNIYDVNIDKLEEKPWRFPGVDITDYFNFGFDENTWKQYCMSLGQLWQTSAQIGIPVNEPAKLNQESTREQIDQVVSGNLLSPSTKSEVPKGRAIQVEDSVVERQPSIHVRRPRSIDSDVIIQIKVHESSDNNSGSVNSNVCDSLEEGEFITGNNRNNDNSSSEHDVLSEEQLEDVKKSKELSVQERNDLIPGMVKAQHPDEVDQHSEDAAEVLEEEMIKTEERVGEDTCSADPCWIEPELSLGDQDLSLTSYTDNDSEGTEDSVHVDNENNHSPVRSHSMNSDTDLKESLSLYHKTSKNISFNRTPAKIAYYSRNRGPVQQERRHQSGRHVPDSKLKKHSENDDVSHIPKSRGRDLPRWGHQFNCRSKEQLQYFGSHKRKDISYNKERKQSCYYDAEKVVDDLVQTYSGYSDREDRNSLRKNANKYFRRNRDKRECFFEQRTLMEYNEDSDWHPAYREHYVDDDLNLLSYREPKKFLPKHSSVPAKERSTQRRRMHHKPHFRDREYDNNQWFDEHESEFLNTSYRMPSSFAERELEYLNNKHEEQFPQIDRALERYAKRGRHRGGAPLVMDTLWSRKREDECSEYIHHQTSYLKYPRQSHTDSARNYVYGTRINENFRGCERHKHATNRGNDWRCVYTDAAEDEDCVVCPVKEREFYTPPSDFLHWTKDDNTFWHHDELHPEEDAFFYEETPRHVTHARCGSLHAKVQSDDLKLQQHQLNFPRRDSDSFLKRSSNVMSRDHCRQAVLRCRKSVDLINREGKSHAKSSRVVCNDRLENRDRGIAKKETVLAGFDDSQKKAIKFDISKSLCNNENKKSLQNLPDKGQKESLDIEEGEIVTEEPYMEAFVSRRDVSKGAAVTDSVKKRMSQNGNNSGPHVGKLDSQKILDTLAKMEKRRERFKQPISMIKEAEKSLKLKTDSVVDIAIGDIKQHRPARKRRWNGS